MASHPTSPPPCASYNLHGAPSLSGSSCCSSRSSSSSEINSSSSSSSQQLLQLAPPVASVDGEEDDIPATGAGSGIEVVEDGSDDWPWVHTVVEEEENARVEARRNGE